jgi:stage V sporulation protein B
VSPSPADPASMVPSTASSAASASNRDLLTDSFRRLSRGASIMVTSTILLFLFNFVGRVAAARALPVAIWGEFNLGVSFTSLLSVVILLGLNQAVSRSLAYEKDRGEQRAIVRWALLATGLISTAGSALVFVAAAPLASLFHDPPLTGVFELLSVSVGFGAVTPVVAAVFNGFQDAFPNGLFNQIVNPALFVIFVLLLVDHFRFGLVGALVAYVIADAVAFVGLAIYAMVRVPRLIPPDTPAPARPKPTLWKLTVSLWGVASLAFITAYVDTLILGAFWPPTLVGYYSTAMTMARVVLLGASALTFVFLPLAARLSREKAYDALRSTYATATRWILILTVPLFLLFTFAPRLSIDAVFGPKYGPSAFPLQFLAITAFTSSMVGPVNATLAGLAQYRTQMTTSSISAITNVVLSFSLIPFFGVFGAAVSWGVARALYPTLGLTALYRGFGVTPFKRSLMLPLAITLAIGIPVFLAVETFVHDHWAVVPLFFFGSGLYVSSLIATRSLVPGDIVAVELIEKFTGLDLGSLRRFLLRHVDSVAA